MKTETKLIISERIALINTGLEDTREKQAEMSTAYTVWINRLTEFAREQWVNNLNHNALEALTLFELTYFNEPDTINESEFSLPFFFFDALDIHTRFLSRTQQERSEALNILTEELKSKIVLPESK